MPARWRQRPLPGPNRRCPEALSNLSASDFASIRYRDERRLFIDPPTGFAVDLAALRASSTTSRSRSSSSRAARRSKLAYDPALFTFGDVPPPSARTPPLEFAGFRVLTALNQPDAMIPFAIFAGASYFQAISKGQQFGVSARGLAIGTGEPEGEEFPFFRAHWLEPPAGDRMVVHSLLDGPSATGAYRFTIRPGDADRRSTSRRRSSPARRSPTSASRR